MTFSFTRLVSSDIFFQLFELNGWIISFLVFSNVSKSNRIFAFLYLLVSTFIKSAWKQDSSCFMSHFLSAIWFFKLKHQLSVFTVYFVLYWIRFQFVRLHCVYVTLFSLLSLSCHTSVHKFYIRLPIHPRRKTKQKSPQLHSNLPLLSISLRSEDCRVHPNLLPPWILWRSYQRIRK